MPEAVRLNLIYAFFRVVQAFVALAIVFKNVVYRLELDFCMVCFFYFCFLLLSMFCHHKMPPSLSSVSPDTYYPPKETMHQPFLKNDIEVYNRRYEPILKIEILAAVCGAVIDLVTGDKL
ncbi:Uncharacterised protein [Actinobacillus pleuropneumoniae]|nr:Uncharacterised protein [Actinobacillus pleuropneumoniae]